MPCADENGPAATTDVAERLLPAVDDGSAVKTGQEIFHTIHFRLLSVEGRSPDPAKGVRCPAALSNLFHQEEWLCFLQHHTLLSMSGSEFDSSLPSQLLV